MKVIPTHPVPAMRGRQHQHQRGVALYVVIVFVLLSMLLALWAARSALFNEILVGNDADYRRAYEAAQAMLQDAELDIRGMQPDGTSCIPKPGNNDICRPVPQPASGTNPATPGADVYFDIQTEELGAMLSTVYTKNPTTKCHKGICQKRADPQDFWNDPATLNAMIATDVGARYGQFTGASAEATANPILADSDAGEGAWYWVEMLPYVNEELGLLANMPPDSNVAKFAPHLKKLFVFRITALARGQKPGTEVVLQSTFSLKPAD